MKKNPISIIEESFQSLKKYLEINIDSNEVIFTASFIKKLQNETINIIEICTIFNQDKDIITKLNDCNANFQGKLLKAEHFFLADFITLFNCNAEQQNEKSRFVMAYYYDALRNKHFAEETSLNQLNQLVYSDQFKNNLQKILQENAIVSKREMQQHYFLLEILPETKRKDIIEIYKNFAENAFDSKFKDEKEFSEFFELQSGIEMKENQFIKVLQKEDTLERVLQELNDLIGLNAIKKDIKELINLLEIQKKRSNEGLKNVEITLHTVFLGSPGTGKTTVARLLGRIFKHLGFLSKGQICETDREGLVAGYVGQTATKVNTVVDASIGGVLFIDEAYALTQNSFGSDYGSEAVNILLKRMEDYRNDLAVVVAGYTEPMKIFIESNPGLRSRFNRYFYFENFTPIELYKIFESFCLKSDFIISKDAKEKVTDTFELLFEKKDESFGNARMVRNVFEKCIQNQANRIVKLKKISNRTLRTLTEEDIPELKEVEQNINYRN